MSEGAKAISKTRELWQARMLVAVAGTGLAGMCVPVLLLAGSAAGHGVGVRGAVAVSAAFALVAWGVRAATPAAAALGGMVCLLITVWTEEQGRVLFHSGLAPLMLLFVLTVATGRVGRARKEAARLAESRRGRGAAQVLANLGPGVLAVMAGTYGLLDRVRPGVEYGTAAAPVMLLAALAEATADTVSSEVGQGLGHGPWLVTTWQPVPTGTDGAVTPVGTAAGAFAACLVVLAGMWGMSLTAKSGVVALAAALAGLMADSLLGATLERRGWLGNDLVNFTSGVCAALLALGLMLTFGAA